MPAGQPNNPTLREIQHFLRRSPDLQPLAFKRMSDGLLDADKALRLTRGGRDVPLPVQGIFLSPEEREVLIQLVAAKSSGGVTRAVLEGWQAVARSILDRTVPPLEQPKEQTEVNAHAAQ